MGDLVDDLRENAGLLGEMAADRIEFLEADREQYAEKVNELRAEVERLTEAADGAMRQDRDQLLAERDALRADAERYRWLRNESRKNGAWCAKYAMVIKDSAALDAAIDNARIAATCQRAEKERCNHADPDYCCGGGYDGPCLCDCHHTRAAVHSAGAVQEDGK